MPKVKFKYNREKDLENFYFRCNQKPIKEQIPEEIKNICAGKPFDSVKDELEEEVKKIIDEEVAELFVLAVQKMWEKINNEYFMRLEKIMNKSFPFEEFVGILIHLNVCGYEPKSNLFQFSIRTPIGYSLLNTAHEIFHIYFCKYYEEKILDKLGEEKTHELREALTVILNLEFSDLWFPFKDRGYADHKKLRDFISDKWKKDKNFAKLLESCIDYLMNTGSNCLVDCSYLG